MIYFEIKTPFSRQVAGLEATLLPTVTEQGPGVWVGNMSRIGRAFSVVLVAATCWGAPGVAFAVDPLVLFLLRMARDAMLSRALEAGVTAATEQAKPDRQAELPRLAPLPAGEGQWLKNLIDESFVHLNAQQREELHASLTRMLNDPRHAQMRSRILAEFTGEAITMRDAHRRLAGLTPDQMKTIAVEARREFERLPAQDRAQMLKVLEHGIPGMPRTMNDIMLAEFNAAGAQR